MTRQMLTVLVAFGVVLAVASLLLRVLTGGDFEVQTIDLILLVIPLLVVALVTGKLKDLDVFGFKADLSEVFATAGKTEIKDQVSESTPPSRQDPVDVDILERAQKGGLQELPQLIGRQLEVLEFELGHGEYGESAIEGYFEALSGSLRVVVVNYQGGKLFAVYNAPDLIGSLRFTHGSGYRQLAQLLNDGSEEARAELAKLPGFVGADNALKKSTSKREALARMESLDTDILPVLNEDERFIGTVGRSKLTASLILAVTKQLEDR